MRRAFLVCLFCLLAVVRVEATTTCAQLPVVPLTRYYGTLDALVNGYCVDGYHFPRLLSTRFWRNTVPPTFLSTRFLYQAEGVLEATALERRLTLDGVQGYVALYTPSVLGYKLWIRPDAGADWTPVRDADAAAQPHSQYHVEVLQSGFEVSWAIAEAWGIPDMVSERGRYLWNGQVCLTESDPLGVCTGTPTDLVQWFAESADFE